MVLINSLLTPIHSENEKQITHSNVQETSVMFIKLRRTLLTTLFLTLIHYINTKSIPTNRALKLDYMYIKPSLF